MAISPTESISSVTASSTLSPSLPRGSEGFQKSLIAQNATLEKPVTNPSSQPAAKPDTRPNPTRSHIERNVTHKTGGLHQRRLQAVNSAAGGFMSYGQFMVEMGLKNSLVAGENAKTDLRGTMLSNELMQSLSPRARQYLIQEKTTGSIRESARHVYSPITGANGPESHYKVIIQAIRVAKHMTHEDMLQGSNINPPGQNIGESLRPSYPGPSAGERVSGGLTTEQRYPGIGSLTHTEAYRELTINNQKVWIRPPSHNGTADTVAPNYSVMYRDAGGKVQEQILGGSGSWDGAARLAKAFLGAGADTAKTSVASPPAPSVPQGTPQAPKPTLDQVISEAVSTVPPGQQTSVTQALRETLKQNNIASPQQAQNYIRQLTPGSEALGQLTQKAGHITAQAQAPVNPGGRNTAVPIMQNGKPIGAIPGKPGEIIQFASPPPATAPLTLSTGAEVPATKPGAVTGAGAEKLNQAARQKAHQEAQQARELVEQSRKTQLPGGADPENNIVRELSPLAKMLYEQMKAGKIDSGSGVPNSGAPVSSSASSSGGSSSGVNSTATQVYDAVSGQGRDPLDDVVGPAKQVYTTVKQTLNGNTGHQVADTTKLAQNWETTVSNLSQSEQTTVNQDSRYQKVYNIAQRNTRSQRTYNTVNTQENTSLKLTGKNMNGLDLAVLQKMGVSFTNADLSGARLQQANLKSVNLEGAHLSDADLSGADLSQANLKGANLSDARLDKANMSGANLEGAQFADYANLRNVNLNGANLSNARLNSANLNGAQLDNANLSGAQMQDASLLRAKMKNTNLGGTNLQNANLREANLNGNVNYENTNLKGADLRRAKYSSEGIKSAQTDNLTRSSKSWNQDKKLW